MARRNLTITANDQRIDRAARELSPKLERWLARATERFVADEVRKLKESRRKTSLSKAKYNPKTGMFGCALVPVSRGWKIILAKAAASQSELEAELLRVLVTHGVRSTDASGKDMAARLDGDWVVSPSLIQLITRQKKVSVKQLAGKTKRRVRDQIRKIMLTASKESPRPSIAEIARRIRIQVVELPPLAGAKNPELIARANRAELIARTESAQDENTGIVEGMAVAGIDEIEWLAHTDGRSGDRHHERMNGKRITLAASRGSDRSKWFLTPLRNRLRYPADPSGPIEDTARCRCSVLPVVRRGSKTLSPGRAKPQVRDGSAVSDR